MSSMNFPESVQYIASLEKRGWRLGLDRMDEFVFQAGLGDAIGIGERGPRFVHVAGTNGKGSVTAMLQSMLVEHCHVTGAFFSPYVYDIRERVQLGRQHISEEEFARFTTQLRPVAEALEKTEFDGPTEFEFKTALGFAYWKAMQARWVALEVGLGGRLDATNVVTPRCSVITSIGWDHMSILGSTLGEIATEKAGIIKPGVPVIVGPMLSEPREAILRRADAVGAPAYLLGRDVLLEFSGDCYAVATPFGEVGGLKPGLTGMMQAENMALAVAAMLASGAGSDPAALARGAARAFIPGRFQRTEHAGVPFILDGAHNLNSAENLSATLAKEGIRSVVLISNMIDGHDLGTFYTPLRGVIESIIVPPIIFYRAREPHVTADALKQVGFAVETVANDAEAILAACAAARACHADAVLVTGSFYLVGQIGRALGLGVHSESASPQA